jgi:two-component system, chemotaxis family, chemotaxis protein CheY
MAYRILIIDDSAVTRKVLAKTIGMVGLPVETILEASNGEEALRLLREQDVDLILADLNMPAVGGTDLAARLRADPRTRAIPLIIVSAEASAQRIQELSRLGVRQYIHKPFTPEQIRQTLLEVVAAPHA